MSFAANFFYFFWVDVLFIVGGIPIAMPTVLSVTLAIGAHYLASKGAIVTRMTSIQELAAVDILCSDKTGTER